MGRVVCGGREIEVLGTKVTTWRYKPKLAFPRLRMRPETRMVCWHWTGGSGLAEQVHSTLTARGLSVHFLIEPDGSIVQFCDAQTRAQHAREANAYAVGVEMTNAANDKPAPARSLLKETIHGIDSIATSFTPLQVKSALALAEALEDAYDLPAKVPMVGADIATTVVPAAELAVFKGHVGHYMLTTSKRDCGLALMRALAARPWRGRDGAAQ